MNSEGLVARCTAAHDMKRAFDVLWMGYDSSRGSQRAYNSQRFSKSRENQSFPVWAVQMGQIQLAASFQSLPCQLRKFSKPSSKHRSFMKLLVRILDKNSWLTSDEQDRGFEWLDLSPGEDTARCCLWSGRPGAAHRRCHRLFCSRQLTFMNRQVTTASSLAAQRGLAEQAKFGATDATRPLPFFQRQLRRDYLLLTPSTNFPDRPRVIAGWARFAEAGRTTAVH